MYLAFSYVLGSMLKFFKVPLSIGEMNPFIICCFPLVLLINNAIICFYYSTQIPLKNELEAMQR